MVARGGIWQAEITMPDDCHYVSDKKKNDSFPYSYHIYIKKDMAQPCNPMTGPIIVDPGYSATEENHHVTVRTFLIEDGKAKEVDTDEIMVTDGTGGG